MQGASGSEQPAGYANQTSPTSRAWGRSTGITFSALGPTTGRWTLAAALGTLVLLLGFGAGFWLLQPHSSAAASSAAPPTGSSTPAARTTAHESKPESLPPIRQEVAPVESALPVDSSDGEDVSVAPPLARTERLRRRRPGSRGRPVKPGPATASPNAPTPKQAARGSTAQEPTTVAAPAPKERAPAPAPERAAPPPPLADEKTPALPLPDPGLVGY